MKFNAAALKLTWLMRLAWNAGHAHESPKDKVLELSKICRPIEMQYISLRGELLAFGASVLLLNTSSSKAVESIRDRLQTLQEKVKKLEEDVDGLRNVSELKHNDFKVLCSSVKSLLDRGSRNLEDKIKDNMPKKGQVIGLATADLAARDGNKNAVSNPKKAAIMVG